MAGNFGNCRHEGGVEFRGGKKPEALIEMIIRYFSNEGDWVLDSFLGSGCSSCLQAERGLGCQQSFYYHSVERSQKRHFGYADYWPRSSSTFWANYWQ